MSTNKQQQVELLPVEQVFPGSHQVRETFDPDALRELARSIAETGLVQPLVVRSAGAGYELLAGERRWRASQMAGLEVVPAVIRDDIDDSRARVIGLVENLQRESLLPVETARGLACLIADLGLTHAAAGERIGKSREYVTNYLRLLDLTSSVRALVDEGRLTLGHAKVLAGVAESTQRRLAHEAVRGQWSVRRLERECRRGYATGQAGRAGSKQAWSRLEGALSDHLGNRVSIRYSEQNRSGELRIGFHNLEEFEGLLERLGWHEDDSSP